MDRKFIVEHEVGGTTYTNGFIIAKHYNHSLAAYKKLVDEARKTFPDLTDEAIDCCTVVASGWCKSCPIIRFLLPNGSRDDGWEFNQDRMTDVCWG